MSYENAKVQVIVGDKDGNDLIHVFDNYTFMYDEEMWLKTYSNIKDKKLLFNLESKVDVMLNDIVGETIRVKQVLLREYYKPLAEPIVDEETGEIIKDTELKLSLVLITS